MLKKILLVLAIAGAMVVGMATPAMAAVLAADPSGEAVSFRWPTLLEFVTAINVVVLPLLVGLVTNSGWSAFAKYMLHALLSAVSGLGAELAETIQAGDTYDLTAGLWSVVITFGLGVLAYKTLGKAETKNGNSIASALANTGNTGR